MYYTALYLNQQFSLLFVSLQLKCLNVREGSCILLLIQCKILFFFQIWGITVHSSDTILQTAPCTEKLYMGTFLLSAIANGRAGIIH